MRCMAHLSQRTPGRGVMDQDSMSCTGDPIGAETGWHARHMWEGNLEFPPHVSAVTPLAQLKYLPSLLIFLSLRVYVAEQRKGAKKQSFLI